MILKVPQRMIMWNFRELEPDADFLDHIKEWCEESGVRYSKFILTHREQYPKKWLYVEMSESHMVLFKLRWL